MKKKKLILEWDETDVQNFVIGMVSSSGHLSFVHKLNQTSYFDFERRDDFEKTTDGGLQYFIHYEHCDQEQDNRFILVKNKGIGGILVNEFKAIDYLLIQNSENSEPISDIKDILIAQKFIQAVIEIDTAKISSINKILLGI